MHPRMHNGSIARGFDLAEIERLPTDLLQELGGHLLGAAVVAADEHGGRIAVESLGRNAEAIRDPNKCACGT
jgi:hypothetical protein